MVVFFMKLFLSITVLLICCLANTGFSQEEFLPPPSKSITKIPFFQLTGGIVIIRGLLDKIPDTLNFVLDTGSGGISLDSTTVDEYKLKRVKSDRSIRGIAGIKLVDFTYSHTLHFPGLNVDSLNFHINNYNLLTSVYGVKIDGIIGLTFLRQFIVKIDYDKFIIEINSPGYIKYPKGGYLMHPGFSAMPYHAATITDAKVVTEKFLLDTGAGLCFLLSQEFVDDSSFISKKHKLFPTQTEGIGGKKIMSLTVLKELKFGPYKFKKVPTFLFDDDYNVTSYPLLGGLIGNDLMRRFNVIINYPDQIIYFKPNTHFSDFFDYSYSGLGIYEVDGEIKIIDIIPGSPGDKAGLKPNDIIFAIDNVFGKNIQLFKSVLQNTDNFHRVVVLRNNKPIEIKLKVKSILKNN